MNNAPRTVKTLTFMTIAGTLAGLATGCAGPLRDDDALFKRVIAQSIEREQIDARTAAEPRATERRDGVEELQLTDERIDQLEEMSGPSSNGLANDELPIRENLLGETQRVVELNLESAIKTALDHNLNLQFARLSPGVSGAELVQSQAAFDWNLFVNTSFARTDNPQVRSFSLAPQVTYQDVWTGEVGLSRNLETGGVLTLQQELSQLNDRRGGGQAGVPNSAERVTWTAELTQPLLRGAGREVALSEVRVRENAERDAVARLRADTIELSRQVEEAYWRLFQAHQELEIQNRLVERGVAIREQVRERRRLDATPAQIADAGRAVEDRRADLLTAQTNLRTASRQLKALLNDPEFTVGSETLLIPSDTAIDGPITFSLLDAIRTALEHRPEIDQALLSIDNTSIRQQVADNGLLPQLDMSAQIGLNGLQSGFVDAYDDSLSGQFVDYIVGLVFEQPLGNRAAEGLNRQRRLERMQSVISFRNTVQQIVLELKNVLDQVVLNYRLIEQTRVARLASAEVLRALLVEKDTISGYTVERLDLELNRQEDLARAERAEIAALVEYNVAIANFYAAMGTLLERNGVSFVVPDSSDVFDDAGRRLGE